MLCFECSEQRSGTVRTCFRNTPCLSLLCLSHYLAWVGQMLPADGWTESWRPGVIRAPPHKAGSACRSNRSLPSFLLFLVSPWTKDKLAFIRGRKRNGERPPQGWKVCLCRHPGSWLRGVCFSALSVKPTLSNTGLSAANICLSSFTAPLL